VTELRALRKDGSEFPVELGLSGVRIRGQWQAVAAVQDVSERARSQREIAAAHAKLAGVVEQLEKRNLRNGILNDLREFLLGCPSVAEVGPVMVHSMALLFPNYEGALYILSPSRTDLELLANWGAGLAGGEERTISPEACWALRRGRPYMVENAGAAMVCDHLRDSPRTPYACLPLMAKTDVIGMLHLRESPNARSASGIVSDLGDMVPDLCGLLAMSISNLRLKETLKVQSIKDTLTGLFNRRYMEECLQREIWRASRTERQIGVVMADIDHFKNLNDVYGHGAGDYVLSAFGNLVNAQIRGSDIACRYGGEEFTIILPEATAQDAPWRANDLREKVRSLKLTYGGRELPTVTISMGVSTYPVNGTTSEELLNAADAALYKAKLAGRDRVVVHGQSDSSPAPPLSERVDLAPAHTLKRAS